MTAQDANKMSKENFKTSYVYAKIEAAAKKGEFEVDVTYLSSTTKEYLQDNGFTITPAGIYERIKWIKPNSLLDKK